MLQVEHVALEYAGKPDFACPNGWLLMRTRAHCTFFINGTDVDYPPNCIVLYQPKQTVTFHPCAETLPLDYICFTTDEAHIAGCTLPFGLPVTLPDPDYYHSLLYLLAAEYSSGCMLREINMDRLMRVLFSRLSQMTDIKPKTHLCKKIHDLKKEIYMRPYEPWSIKQMACMLNISAGYLESTYRNTFGISCIKDVIVSRITLAIEYLQNSTFSINEIVTRCGYRSAEHFYRQFRKITGTTPQGYRLKIQPLKDENHSLQQNRNN